MTKNWAKELTHVMKCNYFNLKVEEDWEWNEPGGGDYRARRLSVGWVCSTEMPGVSLAVSGLTSAAQVSGSKTMGLSRNPAEKTPHELGEWRLPLQDANKSPVLSPVAQPHVTFLPRPCRIWVCRPCDHLSTSHAFLAWNLTLFWKPTVEESTRGHRVHQNQLLLSPCCFCEAVLPPRNSERSLLMLLLVAHPPWEPQPWLLREMLHTPKGDKDSLLSVRKLFQSHTLSKPRFSPAPLWAVVCGENASCTETFL